MSAKDEMLHSYDEYRGLGMSEQNASHLAAMQHARRCYGLFRDSLALLTRLIAARRASPVMEILT